MAVPGTFASYPGCFPVSGCIGENVILPSLSAEKDSRFAYPLLSPKVSSFESLKSRLLSTYLKYPIGEPARLNCLWLGANKGSKGLLDSPNQSLPRDVI